MILDNCNIQIDENDIKMINKSIQEKCISGKGPFVKIFEKKLCEYFQSDFALCCCNGTAAIHMVLLAEDIKSGDEVILPPTAPIMSVLPIVAVGATPIFVDNEPGNFNISIEDLKNKITKKSKLLINVPMWGYANNIDIVSPICKKKGLKILEDNSHCHGTKIANRHLGTFGDYAVFSTHERKLITTGEGAFILVKRKDDYQKLTEIRSFGEAIRNVNDVLPKKGQYGFYFGLNFKLSSINAAIGISQLKKIDTKIASRRKNAERINENLTHKFKLKELVNRKNSINNYYSIVYITYPSFKEKIEMILKDSNIISDPLRYGYCPLYEMPLLKKYKSEKCPNAENLIKSVFTLPVHEGLTNKDIDYITDTLKKINYV